MDPTINPFSFWVLQIFLVAKVFNPKIYELYRQFSLLVSYFYSTISKITLLFMQYYIQCLRFCNILIFYCFNNTYTNVKYLQIFTSASGSEICDGLANEIGYIFVLSSFNYFSLDRMPKLDGVQLPDLRWANAQCVSSNPCSLSFDSGWKAESGLLSFSFLAPGLVFS